MRPLDDSPEAELAQVAANGHLGHMKTAGQVADSDLLLVF
jgi:hypothetical protein